MSRIETVDFAGKTLRGHEMDERVQELRTFVLADDDLKQIRTDEKFLLRYLHCTKFNTEAAFKRIKDYYQLCVENPKWFAKETPTQYRQQLQTNFKTVTNLKDREGRRLLLSRCYNCDTKITDAIENAILDEYVFESVFDEPEVQDHGIAMILDMKGYSMKMFGWNTPTNMKISSAKVDLYPCKELVYHVINTSMLVNAAIKMLMPFLSSKIKDKMKFHYNDVSSLHKYISPEILPPEYGGTGPVIDNEKCFQYLVDREEELVKGFIFNQIQHNK